MKRATNGEWVHIQCALWIPEVTMGDPEKMDNPNINAIPESRRTLKCYICQGGIGCIQVKFFHFFIKVIYKEISPFLENNELSRKSHFSGKSAFPWKTMIFPEKYFLWKKVPLNKYEFC